MSSSFHAYFGSLSISSLASEDAFSDQHDDRSVQSQMELYRRLQDLEEITNGLLSEKIPLLCADHDCFAEIEQSMVQRFALGIDAFDHNQVLSLRITALPDSNTRSDQIFVEGPLISTLDFTPLTISLKRNDAPVRALRSTIDLPDEFHPVLHEGVYSFALTMAHGLINGDYTLSVQMTTSLHQATQQARKLYQSIRVTTSVEPVVRAIPIDVGTTMHGRVAANEYCYYR